jgi:hypothetical protein
VLSESSLRYLCHRRHLWLIGVICGICGATPARAQSYTAAADFLFYGDNTEFANPFREGETLLGTLGRIFIEASPVEGVRLRAGFFGGGRFGSGRAFEHYEPLVALEVERGWSRVIFGSMDTAQTRLDVAGPDLETLHGLLPPLQRETLTFSRGQELGLQWLARAARFEHDAWVDWQRVNTPRARERFDVGYRAGVGLSARTRLHGQWHIVHEGGQQFANGAVKDSQAAAVGLERTVPLGDAKLVVDGHAVASRHVPDRERPALTRDGLGVFARAAVTKRAWRAHAIAWRGCDVIKDEGDPNYLSLRADGARFRGVRDYAEVGLTREFAPAPGVRLFASARLHRVEAHYEYSYRVAARVRLRHGL